MNNSKRRIVGSRLSRREILTLLGSAAAGGMLVSCSKGEEGQAARSMNNPDTEGVSLPVDRGLTEQDPIHYASLMEVAAMVESRKISPVELTKLMLDRITEVDAHLKSYVTVMADSALAAAQKAEQEIASGVYRGPMHGIPIAVKDLCYTQGTRTMGGTGALSDFIPDFDATVVSRLKQAGAILLGKLNLTEGAMAGYHPDFDVPVNPWAADYWSGASSSGSGVATAGGLCFGSLGTDTGGSIRFPSMANGIVGLKPTYGRVSRYGILPLADSLDHVGPMTRRTADAAIMFQTIAGHDENDPSSLKEPVPNMFEELDAGVKGVRIGFDRQLSTEGTDPGLIDAIDESLEVLKSLGAEVVAIEMPEDIVASLDPWFVICPYEAFKAHQAVYQARPDDFGLYFREFLEIGANITEEQYVAASQLRKDFNLRFEAVLASVDAIVSPAGGTTFPQGDVDMYANTADLDPLFQSVQMYFTIPADLAGTPSLTVPCGAMPNGVPYGLQFMGPRLSESLLCQIGHAFEEATSWHDRHPPV